MEARLNEFIAKIKPLDQNAMSEAAARQDQLTKPQGSLGRLETLSIQVAGILRNSRPELKEKIIFTLAADHGVAGAGVSPYPPEVTPQMVLNFLNGGAGINALSRQAGARVLVADLGVNFDFPAGSGLIDRKIAKGTADMSAGPAMSREQALQSILAGIQLVLDEKRVDMIGTGDMGIGNTSPSAAITSVITGAPVGQVTGRGAGLDDQGLEAKVRIIEKALEVNRPDPRDPLDILAKVGGFEIGGIAGLVIGGSLRGVPVVIDGFISGAGALIAQALAPAVKDYLIASHQSVEIGHRMVLEHLGLRPLLDLELRLGEGTGAALAMSIIQSAVAVLNEMATFAEAGVSNK